MEEGVVGGGIALLNVAAKIKDKVEKLEDDEKTGGMIVVRRWSPRKANSR